LVKSTNKLLDVIEKSKSNDGTKLLTSLGITNVGKSTAKSIMKKFKSIDALMQADYEQLIQVNDIGDISAKAILEYFKNPDNVAMIRRLQEYGVNTKIHEQEEKEQHLDGKTFVITGTLPTLGRKDAAAIIESLGGKISSSVSKKTDYLLAGENAGSKLTKAQDLGVTIIDEDMLLKMTS
jgi:NAD-dependent DNA ligase (contains BRCT domain type II)